MVKGMRRPKAASGASKAASGARQTVRVSGLWGLRHWVWPHTKDVVMPKIEEIMVKHKDPKPNKRKIEAYINEVGQVLSACRPKIPPATVATPVGATPRGPSQRRDRESNEPSQRRDHESKKPRHQRGCESQEPSQRRARDPKEPSQRRVPTLCLDLETRLRNAYKPREKVVMRTPRNTPTAAYVTNPNSSVAYTTPLSATGVGTSVHHWLPQEAADWLYQATLYTMPLLQALLGTNKAFDSTGRYLDHKGRPASGGQLAAFYGTECGSRRDRALIAHDTDVDFEAFVTPDFDFHAVWGVAKPLLEAVDLVCTITRPGKYYRISPSRPLAFNDWTEWKHEVRQQPGSTGLSHAAVSAAAKLKKVKGNPPAQPIGPHFIDIGVKVVVPNQPILISGDTAASGANSFRVDPNNLFPIVEGFFGPLRIPLPRTGAVLDHEYGKAWRFKRAVKSATGKYHCVLRSADRHAIWPAVPLYGCPAYMGCFQGAGCDASRDDVTWRWLETGAASGASEAASGASGDGVGSDEDCKKTLFCSPDPVTALIPR